MLVVASVSGSIVDAISRLVRDGGLPAVFLLMAMSCACIPVPSEFVLLFAGFVIADPAESAAHHHLTLLGVVIAALAGSLVGSWVTYGVGRAGRLELVRRHGRWLHLGPAQIERADRVFARYGPMTVLVGRLLPLVRAFVSLPAGVARMPLLPFSLLTLAGSLPWIVGFTLAGEALGSNWSSVRSYLDYVDYAILAGLLAVLAYLVVRRRRPRASA